MPTKRALPANPCIPTLSERPKNLDLGYDAYVTNPARGYAKGYCHGVMLAYMNELDQWCVPDGTSWGEVQDHLALTVAEANIDPFSTMNIGEWIGSAMSVKWPCDDTVDTSVVTDPELIEKLNELQRQSREQQR